MRVKKGDAPSVWIWILAGFIFASVIIAVFWNAMNDFSEEMEKKRQQTFFHNLAEKIQNFCNYPEGSKSAEKMKVYGSFLLMAEGKEICIEGKIKECVNVSCNINVTPLAIPEGIEEEYVFTIAKENGTVFVKGVLP